MHIHIYTHTHICTYRYMSERVNECVNRDRKSKSGKKLRVGKSNEGFKMTMIFFYYCIIQLYISDIVVLFQLFYEFENIPNRKREKHSIFKCIRHYKLEKLG